MCGIVGYIGNKKASDILVSGLKRLEYRGYDSSGIVTINPENNPTLLRSTGKIIELEKLVDQNPTPDQIGIGHTRWATHGAPAERNAHPHRAGDIFLVHNGIIENYKELKSQLSDYEFTSDTDTEVLAALINSFYDPDTTLQSAVTQALNLVHGTYGIAVLSIREPDQIIVARLGSPLLIGVGKDKDNPENIVASDASALLGHTKNAIYLNNGELAIITKTEVKLLDLAAQELTPKVEKITAELAEIQKQGYEHFLLKEIMEQSTTLRSTISGRVDPEKGTMKLGGLNLSDQELRGIKHIVIVGCGTAYYAGMLAAYYIEQVLDDVTTEVVIASEYRYRAFNLPEASVALIVSQSGETADTLACLREIKARGVKTLGIINVVGSTIAREVDGGTYVHAGPEISVASTKAFTSQVATMIMFAGTVAKAKDINPQIIAKFARELSLLPDEIAKTLQTHQPEIQALARHYSKYDHALYLGRDTAYPVALEGALKLKEISYIHAEGYAAGELKHGPFALVDDRFFELFLIIDGWLIDKSLSALQEVKARGGHTVVFTNSTKEIESDHLVRITTQLDLLTPILLNVLQQLFAYYMAVEKGGDVDQPRNLAKSVTVE
ncbi:glutamine--fructose-6-phosphate transaminase (isomerizing) [Candidatus Saccharibacteria bacterium]|nr:glutamine--fructose-6-phosphate transaminase (isomerizing) [Candidatus Saccharibacteria bacterium]